MNKKLMMLIGLGFGAVMLGRKLYNGRKEANEQSATDWNDRVDMASADSFPASDAPSWVSSTS